MKSLVVLFFGMFLWTQQALAIRADVTFASRRGEPFQIIFDGRLINPRVTDRIILQDIPAGYHEAEIRFPDRFGALVHRTRIFLEPGFQTDFMVQITGRRPRVFLNKVGLYPINGGMVPPPPPVARDPYPVPVPRDPRPGGYDDRYDDRYERGNYRAEVMRAGEVDRLLRTLESKPFDDGKMPIVRQVLSEATIYAEDLSRILRIFSFDKNKLELAKMAYNRVHDRRNFYLVYDAFTYDSYARELQRFVSEVNREY